MFLSKGRISFKTKFLVCALCVGAMFCVGGCVPKNEWVFKCGNSVISSGEYIEYMSTVLNDAKNRVAKSSKTSNKRPFDGVRKAKIGSMSGFDWVGKDTIKKVKQVLLLKNEYEKLGLDKQKKARRSFNKFLNRSFDSEFAEAKVKTNAPKIGLDKEFLIEDAIDNCKCSLVLENIFKKGQPRYISDEKCDEFTKQNFMKFKVVKVSKNVNDPAYSEESDSNPGSKLEKKAGVKTPKELADKYMDQLKNGSSIDEIMTSHSELLGLPKTEPQFNFLCKVESEDNIEKVDEELKTLVSEVEVKSGASLKESEKFYYIIQRFDLTDEDVVNNSTKARNILFEQEFFKYVDELEQNNPIECNEKVLNKYTVERQATLMEKHMPPQQDEKGGMFPGLM